MSELTIGQLIKIILGVLVLVVVAVGLFFFFKNYVIDFFKNMAGGNSSALFLNLLK
jgi:hypothetical protein